MNKRAVLPKSDRAAAMAALHRAASHSISKPKPKIRIIHIFAPEIIKTDAANFRDIVQRLTGKPPAANSAAEKMMIQSEEISAAVDRTPEMGRGACGKVKDEEEVINDVVGMWNDVVGMEGFIKNLGEFPLLSSSSAHQIMHGFGETQFV